MKLIKSIDNYRFIGKFTNFLFTIAVNTCNDYYRKPKYIYEDISKLEKGDKKARPIEIIIRDEISKNIVETIELGQKMMEDILTTDNSLFNFAKEQFRYISPYLWLIQFILMIVMMFLTSNLVEDKMNVPRLLFTLSSIFVFIGVPELVKSMIYNMSELEYTCKHSMPKVLITRLLIISMVNVLATTIMISFLSIRYQISFVELLLYGFVPLSIANGINFFLINLLKTRSIITFIGSSIFSGGLMIIFTGSEIFIKIGQITWIFIFIISLLVLFIEVYYLIKKLDKGRL